MTLFRVAIVGTGNIAKAHARALVQLEDRVEIVAALDTLPENLERFCKEFSINNLYTDMQTMLNEQRPDLIHICTPPNAHFDLCSQALRGGAHVICEKPLVASLDEVDRLQAIEQETGKSCSTIFQWRFGPGVQQIKPQIDNNEFGRPLVGICNTLWYRDHAYYEVPWRGKWDTELGGVSMGHGIHAMDLFLWLMGDWTSLSAFAGTLDRNMEVEDVSMVQVRFSNGALGSIVNSVLSPRQESYLRFDFQQATVELKDDHAVPNTEWQISTLISVNNTVSKHETRTIPEEVNNRHTMQIVHTLDKLEQNQNPLVTGEQGRNIIEFLTALYKSAVTGQIVNRNSIMADDPFYYHVYGATKPVLKQ